MISAFWTIFITINYYSKLIFLLLHMISFTFVFWSPHSLLGKLVSCQVQAGLNIVQYLGTVKPDRVIRDHIIVQLSLHELVEKKTPL